MARSMSHNGSSRYGCVANTMHHSPMASMNNRNCMAGMEGRGGMESRNGVESRGGMESVASCPKVDMADSMK